MKTLTKWMLAALGSVAAIGCDPFEEAVTDPPVVVSAGFTSVAETGGYEGTPALVTGVPSTCTSAGVISAGNRSNAQPIPTGFIFLKFNKLLDGNSIQDQPTDCTPDALLNLAVTINGSPTPPAGQAWYACYNPQAPAPTEGASVIIFLDTAASNPGGWFDAKRIPTDGDLVTTVRATGTVHDKDGRAADFDVTVEIDPDPGTPGALSFTNFNPAVNPTEFDISWTASVCAAATATYSIQRAPDVAGAPGTWANIATGLTATTYHDSGLTAGVIYWYRVRADGTDGSSRYTAQRTQRPAAPAAPTFANFAATSVDVNWTATASAASYNVQRAPDVNNAPGTWADLATGLTVLTYTDATLVAGTKYWYRIVGVNAYGSTNGAAASQVPAAPAVPAFSNITATTLTVTWGTARNAATYTVQRAPDASGSPGTWADIATGLTIVAPATTGTYNDAGLTAGTRYWYRVVGVNANASTAGIAGFVNTSP